MLNWVTSSTLSSIETGYISELSVSAAQTLSTSEISYKIISGNLPPGLQFRHDGTIQGTVNYNSTGTYTFTVEAFDAINIESINRQFNLQVSQSSNKKFTSIYFKPLMEVRKRHQYQRFINDPKIFLPNLIYRFYDK